MNPSLRHRGKPRITRHAPRATRHASRPGFTLIELIVVISIIMMLATLVVAIAPTVKNLDKVGQGATQLQGWLSVAKQNALRDRAPRGVRLIVGAGNMVTSVQAIEQPDDYLGPAGSSVYTTSGGGVTTVVGTGADFSGGFGGAPSAAWPVQTGDYIEFYSGVDAKICRITPINASTLTFPTPAGWIDIPSTSPTSDFRIVRAPRPRSGEATLPLPANVVIDLNTNAAYGSPLPPVVNGSIDILFTPTGTVSGPGVPGRDIRLWLRDTSAPATGFPNLFKGDQKLVALAIRTGLIAICDVDITNVDVDPTKYDFPYSLTQDGKASGY